MMRTTLHIDDDVYRAAKSLASAERKGVGAVISRLARKGLAPLSRIGVDRGFPVFEVAPDAAPITIETVRQCEDDL